MRHTLVALALSAAVIPALAGDTTDAPAPVVAMRDEADAGKTPRSHDDEVKDRGHTRKEPHARKTEAPDGFDLAVQLSALETRIGIKAVQLDAWRDYTSGLQSLLAPPEKSDDEQGEPPPDAHGPKDPFDRDQKLADGLIQRAAEAERLKAAIAALRNVLTPQQLEQLASMDRRN